MNCRNNRCAAFVVKNRTVVPENGLYQRKSMQLCSKAGEKRHSSNKKLL